MHPRNLIVVGMWGVSAAMAVAGSPTGDNTLKTPPPAPAPPTSEVTLPPPSALDPTIQVRAPLSGMPGTGTAFSVSPAGVWLTARHVVEGCAQAAIAVDKGQGVAAEVRLVPRAETAILITQGGAPALKLATPYLMRRGMAAFDIGYPRGRPGEVVTHLVGRENLLLRGRHTRREAALAWRQSVARSGSAANLVGLSGAPALDGNGEVIGMVFAQARRHGRLYTTTTQALWAALKRADVAVPGDAEALPLTGATYQSTASTLRDDLRIVPVMCLGR